MKKNIELEYDYKKSICQRRFKTIILDDDPTGSQTVKNIYVYTNYDYATIKKAFLSSEDSFFILTNSRSLLVSETITLHEELMDVLETVSSELGIKYQLISRSDSTLRQHYPIESDTINQNSKIAYDCEIFIPALISAQRITIDNEHYLKENNILTKISDTDYAKDKSFGFSTSNLPKWIQEKTKDTISAEDVISITRKEIANLDTQSISKKILATQNFQKIIVNIETEEDMLNFCVLIEPLLAQRKILFRTAATFVKFFIGCFSNPLITAQSLIDQSNKNGGLIMIGSHVAKTTQQLANLTKNFEQLEIIEFNQHLVLSNQLAAESARVVQLAQSLLENGKTVVVHTRRDRIDFPDQDEQSQLNLTNMISQHFTEIVSKLDVTPKFLIAKGGITSSDIATKALKIDRAFVAGQILSCVPVWFPDNSKFSTMPYIIFPGNIGRDEDLTILTKQLMEV